MSRGIYVMTYIWAQEKERAQTFNRAAKILLRTTCCTRWNVYWLIQTIWRCVIEKRVLKIFIHLQSNAVCFCNRIPSKSDQSQCMNKIDYYTKLNRSRVGKVFALQLHQAGWHCADISGITGYALRMQIANRQFYKNRTMFLTIKYNIVQ